MEQPGRIKRTVAALKRLDSGERLIARLDPEQIATRRRWRFKPKGAPKGLQAYVAEASA